LSANSKAPHIITRWNPFYSEEDRFEYRTIEVHCEILEKYSGDEQYVWYGKISKSSNLGINNKDVEMLNQRIASGVEVHFYMYCPEKSSLTVGKLEEVSCSNQINDPHTPTYYARVPHKIPLWFKLSDIRRLDLFAFLLSNILREEEGKLFDPVSTEKYYPRKIYEDPPQTFFNYSLTRERKWFRVILVSDYVGTVAVSGSNSSAYEAINYAKKMLFSISESDPQRAAFVDPAINVLKVAAEVVQKQEIELARTEKKDLEEYEKRISEYRSLLGKNAEESEFQTFFEKNPVFLESRFKSSFPKKSLGGERIPDFILLLHDLSYLVVEIEKPALKLFNQNGDPRAELTHAQQQVRNYLKWVVEDKEYLKTRGFPNLTADNVRGLVVIGKDSDMTEEEKTKLESLNAEVRSKYEIKTFDRILLANESVLANLKTWRGKENLK